tara:strand:- start:248 stop:2134 length:1887 start_codon:yes stop_codon:yes gene_type:complete
MIDSDKLMGRGQKNSIILSEKNISNLGIVRKRLIDIDGMLKEQLVLSKVREGIRRQEEERLRRLEQEKEIEDDDEDDDDISDQRGVRKKPKPDDDSGGILTSITSLLTGGVLAFIRKNANTFKLAANILKGIAGVVSLVFVNLTKAINIGYSAVSAIDKAALKFFGDKGLKTLKQFQKVFTRFVNVAVITAAVSAGTGFFGKKFLKKVPKIPKIKGKSTGVGANVIKQFDRLKTRVGKTSTNIKQFARVNIGRGRRLFDFETAAEFAKRTGRPFPNVAAGEKFIPRRNISRFFDERFLTPAGDLLQRGKKGIGDTFQSFKNIFPRRKFKQQTLFENRNLVLSKLTPKVKDVSTPLTRARRLRSFDSGLRLGDLVDDVPKLIQTLLRKTRLTPKNLSKILKPVMVPFRKILKRFPIIGPLLDFGLGLALGDSLGMAAFTTATSTLFGFIGGAIGSLIPGPGTIVGGLLGGLIGDQIGRSLYNRIFKKTAPIKVQPPIAATPGIEQGIDSRTNRRLKEILGPDPEADQLLLDIENEVDDLMKKSEKNLFGFRRVKKMLKRGSKIFFAGGALVPDIGSSAYYDDPMVGSVQFIPIQITTPSKKSESNNLIAMSGIGRIRQTQSSLYAGGLS